MFGNKYLITNCGQIINVNNHKESHYNLEPSGYLTVTLYRKKYLVHRLVAMLFCNNPESKPIVDHKNRIRSDNRASNLHWVTYKENNLNREDTLPNGMRKCDLSPADYKRQQANRWRKNNPDKIKQMKKDWYLANKNKPEFKAKRAKSQREYRKRLRGTSN